jgi:hypothetical protein
MDCDYVPDHLYILRFWVFVVRPKSGMLNMSIPVLEKSSGIGICMNSLLDASLLS